jgi:hypothetical protein
VRFLLDLVTSDLIKRERKPCSPQPKVLHGLSVIFRALFEDIRPDFIYSLHNSGFGGAYFYVSEEAESKIHHDRRPDRPYRCVPGAGSHAPAGHRRL